MPVKTPRKKNIPGIILGALFLFFFTLGMYHAISDWIKTVSNDFQRDVNIEQHLATLDATVTSKYTTSTYTVGRPMGRWTTHYFVKYTWKINDTTSSDTQELASDYGAYLAIKNTIPLKYDAQDPSYHTVNMLSLPTTTNRTITIVIGGFAIFIFGGLDAVCIWALVSYIVRK